MINKAHCKKLFLLPLIFSNSLSLFAVPSEDLRHELEMLHYWEIYQTNIDRHTDLWKKGENAPVLLEIIASENSSDSVRFLAAEILWNGGGTIPENLYPILAKSYGKALAASDWNAPDSSLFQLSGNHWGFLNFQGMEDHGMIGDHLLLLGEKMIPVLLSLLDHEGNITYEGSKDATTGNTAGFRIKDVAAYYLAEICGITYDYSRDRKEQHRRREELRMSALEQNRRINRMTVDIYATMITPNPKRSILIEDERKIEKSFQLLEKIPLQGDYPWMLAPSVSKVIVHYYMDEYLVKEVKIFNDKVQAADARFFDESHQNEEEHYLLYLKELLNIEP